MPPKPKVKIDIERIKALKKELSDFNKLRLQDIEFYENGKKLDIKSELVKEFEFIGLNNVDFIMTEFYKEGFRKL